MPLFRVPLSLPIQSYPTWRGSCKIGFLKEEVQMQVGLGSDPVSPTAWPGPLPYIKMGLVIPTFQDCYKVMCQGFGTPPTPSMKSLLIPPVPLISPSSESLTLISASHLVMNPLYPLTSPMINLSHLLLCNSSKII